LVDKLVEMLVVTMVDEKVDETVELMAAKSAELMVFLKVAYLVVSLVA